MGSARRWRTHCPRCGSAPRWRCEIAARPKVVVTRRIPESVEAKAKELFDVRLNADDTPMSTEALQEAMRTADGLLPTVTDRITAEVLGATPRRVSIVANFG